MRGFKMVKSGWPAVYAVALLSCAALTSCKGLFGGHGGQNQTAPVTGLTATAASGQVTLNWNGYSGATSYNVWRGTTNVIPTSGGVTYLPVSPTGTTFTDTTVTNGTTYYYAVNANGSWGVSNFSNIVSATP